MTINTGAAIFRMAAILLALSLARVVPTAAAQTDTDQKDATAQVHATDAASADMARKVDQLEKEVEELRSQLSAMKQTSAPAAPAGGARLINATLQDAPAGANAAAQSSAAAPAAPAGPSLPSLLGPVTLSGLVDGYYEENFGNPASRTSSLRTFDALTNQFGLNLIELTIDKPPSPDNSRTGYHISLGFGQALNVVNGTDPGGLGFAQYLKEGYFSYLAPVGKGLQFDFGKFVTPAGAEVIETNQNWNYSRSLLFDFAIPFFHYGLRAKYNFSDKFNLTGYVVNGWNDIVDNNSGKTYGLSAGWNPSKKWALTQTYLAGPTELDNTSNWRQLWDTVLAYTPNSKLSWMANYDYGRGDRITPTTNPVWWDGIAGYVKYAFNSKYTLATRYEYYDDHDGFTTGIPATTTTAFIPIPQHINEVTGTLERDIGSHIISRFEYRHDVSNKPSFFKGNTPVDAQDTVTGGLIYVFDSKEGSK